MKNYKKNIKDRGFTIPELIIFLVVLGWIVMQSLPSFINGAGKGKKGIWEVGAMNRAQQAYYVENKEFTKDLGQLGLGIPTETEKYKYLLRGTDSASFHYAIPKNTGRKADLYCYLITVIRNTVSFYIASECDHRLYVGGVFLGVDPASLEETTLAILCQATEPRKVITGKPQMKNGVPTCPTGTEQI